MKLCPKCNQPKPLTDFNQCKSRADGLNCYCRDCTKAYYADNRNRILEQKKEYAQTNKEHIVDYRKQRYQSNKQSYIDRNIEYTRNNWEWYLLQHSKENASKKNLEHTLSINDIVIPNKCPYLTIALTREIGQGQLPTNASIDRINNSKGYTPDNIRIISRLANTMKNKATKEQLITFAKNILKIHPINKGA